MKMERKRKRKCGSCTGNGYLEGPPDGGGGIVPEEDFSPECPICHGSGVVEKYDSMGGGAGGFACDVPEDLCYYDAPCRCQEPSRVISATVGSSQIRIH